jgi:hypothetical protein
MTEVNIDKRIPWYEIVIFGLGYGFIVGFLIISCTHFVAMLFDTPFTLSHIIFNSITLSVFIGVPSGIVALSFLYYFFLIDKPVDIVDNAIHRVSLLSWIGGIVGALVGGITLGLTFGCFVGAMLASYGTACIAIVRIGIHIRDR